jgi:hypothetical protein
MANQQIFYDLLLLLLLLPPTRQAMLQLVSWASHLKLKSFQWSLMRVMWYGPNK